MTRKAFSLLLVTTVAVTGGADRLGAQTWQDVQVSDLETMRDKYVSLARAFDESLYDWRPMEGVRSVRDVLSLVIAEANIFPRSWGYPVGPAAADGFEAEIGRLAEVPSAALPGEIEASFAHLISVVGDMPERERQEAAYYFGHPMPLHASIATGMNDMHEHLGQLIAYARTNHVVPPWSAGN